MRVAAFVSHFYGAAVLQALIDLSPTVQVVLVVTDDPKSKHSNASRRLWKYGWDESLRSLVPRIAVRHGIPVVSENIRSAHFEDAFLQAKPNSILSCIFGQRIPQSCLDHVSQRAYNLHMSTPGYGLELTRGSAALETLVTSGKSIADMILHRMTIDFDNGETVARSTTIPLPADTLETPRSIVDYFQATAELPATLIRNEFVRVFKAG
ncbi:MAG TPA: hypothetical protein DDZ51_25975 [Planctomycetaceae bacterium]|nr:hypothetical protein [Planctomycetaceae bacterium]